MSRIGYRKIAIPEGVNVEIGENLVTITGPKGTLSTHFIKGISVEVADNQITVDRKNDNFKAMHGTVNANITNLIEGVTKGYEKGLEIVGVGYRFAVKGNILVVSAGYSHPVEMEIPEGIEVIGVNNTEVTVKGIDKILVGEFAANVRKVRPPEPYKGKGIRYKDEHIRRKEGKKAA